MDNMDNMKKVVFPTLIAVVFMLVLIVGATYAYVSVTSNNSFGTPTIKSSIPSIGSVTINKGTDLTLNLTLSQVQKPSSDVVYYATASGPSTQATSPVIATATVTGEGTFTCSYTISVSASGELFTNSVGLGGGLLYLTINGGTNGASATTHDFNTAWSNKTVTGTLTGITSGAAKTITAQLYYKNSATIDQTKLNGKSGTVTFTMTDFSCTATS